MRITLTTGPFYPAPPAPCGAVERLWFDLGRRFAAAGHDVTLLSRDWPGMPAETIVDGMRIVRRTRWRQTGRIAVDLGKDLAFSARMLPLFPPGDVVVTNNFWMPVLLPRLKRSAGAVVVNVNRMPKRQMRLYGKAARLVAVSQAVAEAIRRQTPAAVPRVTVIGNPIDASIFSPPPAPRDYTGTLRLLYAGRIHPEKGLERLIDAVRITVARDADLRVTAMGPHLIDRGGGGEDYLAGLKRRSNGLPIEFRPPEYGREALAERFREAHLFCYPSIAEGGEALPVAPVEAMATGLVPIVSGLAVFDEYMTPENGRRFDHRSSEAAASLADVLIDLLSRRDALPAMARAARASAERFDYAQITQQYLDLFDNLMGGPGVGEA